MSEKYTASIFSMAQQSRRPPSQKVVVSKINTHKNKIKNKKSFETKRNIRLLLLCSYAYVFRIPDGQSDEFEAEGYNEAGSERFCKSLGKRCPFSLLEYILHD
jgi:hypothetical protein